MSCPQIPERFRLVFHGPGGEIGYLRIPTEKDFLIWYIVKSIVAVGVEIDVAFQWAGKRTFVSWKLEQLHTAADTAQKFIVA